MEDMMAQAQQAQHAAAAQEQQLQQAQHSPLEQRRMGAAEKLVAEFENLQKQRPWTSYGAHAQSQIQKKREAKRPPPQNATLKFSLLPAAEPESFSPDELYALATDTSFVRKTLKTYMGKEPTQQQISALQDRITAEFPQLATSQKVENRPISISDVKKQMFNSIFQASEKGNFKPVVDFILEYPEIFPTAVEDAKKVKSQGYTVSPEFDINTNHIKGIVNAYAKHSLGKEELFRRATTNEGWEGPEGQEITNAVLRRIQEANQKNNLRSSELKNPESKAEIERNLLSRMQESQNVEEEVERLRDVSKRIAPLTESHEEAKQLLKRGISSPTLATARSKLSDAERMDIPGEIAPYLEAANKPMREYVRQFMVDYRPIIKGYREEAAKDFLEHDIPKINSEFASKGAFFSGARESAINKARADKEKRIERETQKLLVHGHEQARKHFHSHREGTLKSAEIAGNARKAQREGLHHQAAALQANSQAEQAANLANASALSGIGKTQQQQNQNELDVRMAEHQQQQERPFVELSRKHALMQGHQLPAFNFSPIGINPPPPNVFGMGANALGLASGLNKMGYSHEAPFKKGGHVRSKYANGGPIAKHAGEWHQFEKHMEGTPSARVADESMREAQAMRNHRVDPMGAYLMMLTGHQMANPGKPMMQTFGEGTLKGYEAFNSAKAYNAESQKRYINLINAINESRMKGEGLLANYHLKRSDQDETQRYHNMSHAESVRAHNMMYERQKEKQNTYDEINPNVPKFSSKEEEKSFWKEQTEANKHFRESRKSITKDANNFRFMKKLIDKGIGRTGPLIGWMPNAAATVFDSSEKTSNRFLVQKGLNEKILELSSQQKGTQSDNDMNFMKATAPTMHDTPLTFKKWMDKWSIMTKRNEDFVKFIDEKKKEGIPTTIAESEWNDYVNENPLFSEEEDQSLENAVPAKENAAAANDNDGEWVWMQFPGESKQKEIAKEDVAKAQARGAKIVQLAR